LKIDTIFILIQIGIIPAIISVYKILNGEKKYWKLYLYLIVSYIIELVSNRLINSSYFDLSNIIVNTYFLFEVIIILLIIQSIINKIKFNIYIITIIVLAWFIENFIIHKIYNSEIYFNSVSTIIEFCICIYGLIYSLNKNYKSFFKEADIIMILTILFSLSFRVVFEFIYYNYEGNVILMKSISKINNVINFITNILFIYCLLCIKNSKKLISLF
jgi:hypothetical protein